MSPELTLISLFTFSIFVNKAAPDRTAEVTNIVFKSFIFCYRYIFNSILTIKIAKTFLYSYMKKIKIKKNNGILFFITGLSGAGKTSTSLKIKKYIIKSFGPTIIIHSEKIRKIYD